MRTHMVEYLPIIGDYGHESEANQRNKKGFNDHSIGDYVKSQ